MIPSRRLLQLLAAWLVLSVLASLWPRFAPLWKIGAGFVAGIAALDAVIVSLSRRLTVRREVPGRLALGVGIEIPLTLHNPNTRTVNTEFFDGLPETVGSTQLPWSGTVVGGGQMARPRQPAAKKEEKKLRNPPWSAAPAPAAAQGGGGGGGGLETARPAG